MGELRAPCRYQKLDSAKNKDPRGDRIHPVWHPVYRVPVITVFLFVPIGGRQNSEHGFLLSSKGFPPLDGNSESSDREYLAKRLAARNGDGGLPLAAALPPCPIRTVEQLGVPGSPYRGIGVFENPGSNQNTI